MALWPDWFAPSPEKRLPSIDWPNRTIGWSNQNLQMVPAVVRTWHSPQTRSIHKIGRSTSGLFWAICSRTALNIDWRERERILNIIQTGIKTRPALPDYLSIKVWGKNLALIAVVVRDYDEAIDFYTRVLKFNLVEDTPMSETKRWVVGCPARFNSGCNLLLAKAANDHQQAHVGNQTGGRVFLLHTADNFARDFDNLISNHVTIVRQPTHEPYGTVAVFQDLYGNLWDLIEPKTQWSYTSIIMNTDITLVELNTVMSQARGVCSIQK